MNLRWIHYALFILMALILVGCGQTVEEQVTSGIASAQSTFSDTPASTNTEIGEMSLYLPIGFKIEEGTEATNFIVMNGKDSYILFVNPIEHSNSQLNYNLLLGDQTKNIVKQQTFEQDGVFGFSAVVKHSEEQFEIIVSIGGIKMTTMSSDKKIDEKMANMMEVVRSIDIKN